MNMNVSGGPGPQLLLMVILCFWLATFAVHLAFALGVAIDSRRLKQNGDRTVFVDSSIWTLATLLAGPLVAAAYWILHRSALRVGQADSTIAG
jgi:hypothetical protein